MNRLVFSRKVGRLPSPSLCLGSPLIDVFDLLIVLALFAGEEQGLLGSNWYARYLKEELQESVVWMLQVDMVGMYLIPLSRVALLAYLDEFAGYRAPNEPPQLALPDLIGLPQAAYLVGNLSNTYVPELVVGRTSACCSDHQSFVQNAIASTWIFERNGPIADPYVFFRSRSVCELGADGEIMSRCYHSSCDLSERRGYDFQQILMHTKVAFGTMWVVGGGRLE